MKRFFGLLFVLLFVFVGLQSKVYAAPTENVDEEGSANAADETTLEWDIYGSLVFDGFYTSTTAAGQELPGGIALTGVSRKDGFEFGLLNMSYVGLTLTYGQFDAVIEVEPSLDALVNYLYGKYTFNNGGYILIGQDIDIASYSFGQVSNGQNSLIDYGGINDVNRPMVKFGMHGLNVAVLAPVSVTTFDNDWSYDELGNIAASINDSTSVDFVEGADMQVFEWIPRLQLSYDIESNIFNGSVFGSYAYYLLKTKNQDSNYKNYDLHAFHIGLGGEFSVTDNFFIQIVGYYGMNMMLDSSLTNTATPSIFVEGADNKISVENVQSAGGALGFGYKINDMFTPQIGAGFSSSFGGPIAGYDDAWGTYVNVVMQFNKWIALIPEIAFTDDLYDGNGNRQSNKIYAGAQVQITF